MATILINERNQSLNNVNIEIPKKIINLLKQKHALIDNRYGNNKDSSYKNLDGYKRNQTLTKDNYNQRSDIDTSNNIINYNNLVKWKHDFDSMPQTSKNISYELNGGKEAYAYVQNTLSRLRNSVEKVNQEKKSSNLSKSKVKPQKYPTKIEKISSSNLHVQK